MTKRQRVISEEEAPISTPGTYFGGRRSVRESISLRFPTEEEKKTQDTEEITRARERIKELERWIEARRK